MSKFTSDMNKDNLKTIILSDRMMVLNAICEEINSKKSDDKALKEFIDSFSKNYQKYLSLDTPSFMDKKRRKKVQRFRKISPYLAFCAYYRDSKRDKTGKLSDNVLTITKQAGALWKKMSEKERKPWEQKAIELTEVSKKAWDEKERIQRQKLEKPSEADIREMKKNDLSILVEKSQINITARTSLKEIRELLIKHYYPVSPSKESISKMKKSELQELISKIGIQSSKDIKSMQNAIISHYYPTQS